MPLDLSKILYHISMADELILHGKFDDPEQQKLVERRFLLVSQLIGEYERQIELLENQKFYSGSSANIRKRLGKLYEKRDKCLQLLD